MGVQELVHKKDLHNQEQHKETLRSGREYSVIGQKQAASLVDEGRRNVMKGNQNVCSQFLHLIIDCGIDISIYYFRCPSRCCHKLLHVSSIFKPNTYFVLWD